MAEIIIWTFEAVCHGVDHREWIDPFSALAVCRFPYGDSRS